MSQKAKKHSLPKKVRSRRIILVQMKDVQHRCIPSKGSMPMTELSNHSLHHNKVDLVSISAQSCGRIQKAAFQSQVPHNPNNPQNRRPNRSSHGPDIRLPQGDPSPLLRTLFAQEPEVPLAVFSRSRRFWHWNTAFIGGGSRRGEVDGGVIVGRGLRETHFGGGIGFR